MTDKKSEWELIKLSEQSLAPRQYPIVCSVADDKLVVMGGIQLGHHINTLHTVSSVVSEETEQKVKVDNTA